MSTRLTWNGAQVAGRVNDAAKIGLDQTAADCVAEAQQPPPRGAPVDTGLLRNSITFRPAIRQGNRQVVRWGLPDGPDYGLVQEMRNSFLRRAADSQYPTLESRIRAAL